MDAVELSDQLPLQTLIVRDVSKQRKQTAIQIFGFHTATFTRVRWTATLALEVQDRSRPGLIPGETDRQRGHFDTRRLYHLGIPARSWQVTKGRRLRWAAAPVQRQDLVVDGYSYSKGRTMVLLSTMRVIADGRHPADRADFLRHHCAWKRK